MSPSSLTSTARTGMYLPAIITVLIAIFVIGFLALASGSLPLQVSDARWRFTVMSVFLGGSPQMAFMLMVIALAALFGNHFGLARWVAFATIAFGILLIVLIPFYGLDLITVRKLQRINELAHLTREGFRIIAVTGGLALLLIWAGRRGIAATKPVVAATRRTRGDGLIVAQEMPREGQGS